MSRRISRSIHPTADDVELAKRRIAPGSHVQLLSGGNSMVVKSIIDSTADCVWIDRFGKDRHGTFPILGLKNVPQGSEQTNA